MSGHQTSISLENEFADTLQKIADARGQAIASIIAEIDRARAPGTNLSSAVRVWILKNAARC